MAASTVKQINLPDKQRAERKALITVAEWKEGTGDDQETLREILGTRTPDSSVEYNLDMETSTDIRGINYTDVNKTQPQQDFDPYLILGGSKLCAFLNDIRRRNALAELSQFTVYLITSYVGTSGAYEAERHSNCTIAYNSLGGESNVNMPISVYFSNDWEGSGAPGTGTVDKLSDDFTFTADVAG